MNPEQLRYLSVINRHVGGPLQAMARDRLSSHQLKCLYSVLTRLIVADENAPTGLTRLRQAVHKVLPDLDEALGPAAADVAALRQLSASDDPDATALESSASCIARRLGARDTATARVLLRALVEADLQNWQRIETDYAAAISATPVPSETDDMHPLAGREAALIAMLQAQCGESPALTLGEIETVPGGFSKQTVFVNLEGNRILPDRVVLRIDRPESPRESTVVAEYPLLETLYAAGVRVPRPLALDHEDVVGTPLMVMERSPGRVAADGHDFFEPDPPASWGLSLARELAKMHSIPADRLPHALPGTDDSNAARMEEDIRTLEAVWRQTGRSSVTVDATLEWLLTHLHHAGETKVLIHGDLRFHNMLVDERDVSAILDWEIPSLGDPGFDLGYAYHHVTQLLPWQDFLGAYAEAGGSVPSTATLSFYALRSELFILAYLSRMEAGLLAGDFDKLDFAYAASQLRQHTHYLLARRLSAVLAGESL